MPAQIVFPEDLCANELVTPEVAGCEDANRVEWLVDDKPTGSQVIISDDTIDAPDFTVTEDGEYTFTLCCYFEEGDTVAPVAAVPQLNCPLGVIAGQIGTVLLTGCEDANIEVLSFGGVATGASFDNLGVGSVTTDATMPGTASVFVRCTVFDEDFNQTVTDLNCDFDVIDPSIPLVCSVSPPITQEFITCGTSCECTTITVVFDCNETVCDTAQIGIVFKECPECPDPEDCEELERVELLGGQSVIAQCNEYLTICASDNCFEEECCEPHMPVFHWNNLCSCPGWTMEAPAVNGTDIYNTCTCNPGQKWCFEGSATIIMSGPPTFVDSLVIWGHNITDGTISVSPLNAVGGTMSVGVVNDGACIEGYTEPVVISFFDPQELPEGTPQIDDLTVTDIAITITSNTGGIVCIDQLFVGQKFFLPEDRLPANFQNPHDGTDYELEYKESSCGPLSQSLKHVQVDMELELDCLSDEWMKEVWRPFLRYSQRHGILFQWSRNRCPNDLFRGVITGPVGPSSWSVENKNTVVLSARGNITQPQPLLLV